MSGPVGQPACFHIVKTTLIDFQPAFLFPLTGVPLCYTKPLSTLMNVFKQEDAKEKKRERCHVTALLVTANEPWSCFTRPVTCVHK